MSEQHDRRWLDAESAADARLAELLDAGRMERPSEAQLQALAKRLGPTFDGPGPSGGGDAASAVPQFAWVIAAAAVVALCALWTLRGGRADDAAERGVAAVPSQARPPAAASARPSTAVTRIEPADTDAGAPQAPEQANAGAHASSRGVARASRGELALLEEAQHALAKAPKRALAATEEHAKSFPRSQYAQEREVLAIDALTRLNEGSQAKQRADRFLARYPGSSHARRVRELLSWAPSSPTAADAGAR